MYDTWKIMCFNLKPHKHIVILVLSYDPFSLNILYVKKY